MATEKTNGDPEISSSQNEESNQQYFRDMSEELTAPRFGKALAHRALYGSSSRGSGNGRKVRDDGRRKLPSSRLSKVLLANDVNKSN
ncbi:hypothetical protein M5689_004381 [Euphorbia peplus]|nr:hypothetical protein M5689_004381 [Euphorbia peplus]